MTDTSDQPVDPEHTGTEDDAEQPADGVSYNTGDRAPVPGYGPGEPNDPNEAGIDKEERTRRREELQRLQSEARPDSDVEPGFGPGEVNDPDAPGIDETERQRRRDALEQARQNKADESE